MRSPGDPWADGIAGFGGSDVFLYDRKTETTSRISTGNDGHQLDGDAFFGAISADGSEVLFVSDAAGVVPGQQPMVVNRPPDSTLPVPLAFVRDMKSGTVEQVPVPPDTVWIGRPGFTPDGHAVFAAGVSRIHEGSLDSWNYYEFTPTRTLRALSPSSASSQFCPRAAGTRAVAWCADVTDSGVIWQTADGLSERIAPMSVVGVAAPHESNAEPSLSTNGSVLAFVVDGRSTSSGSNTSVIYLVAR